MKREFLTELGIAEDVAAKIMEANGDDIKRETGKITKANEQRDAAEQARDALQAQLDEVQKQLKAMPSAEDKAAMDEQVKKLTEQMEQDKKAHAAELARIARQGENKEFFSGLKTPFINDETREFYAAKLEAALDDPKFKNKNRQEILDALTVGEDGKPKPGVYKEPENPNPILNQPPVGDIPDKPARPTPPLLI